MRKKCSKLCKFWMNKSCTNPKSKYGNLFFIKAPKGEHCNDFEHRNQGGI